jgi:hypothetical protein
VLTNTIKRQITLTYKQIKNLGSVFKLYKKKFKQREIGVFELYAVKNNLLNERIKLLTLTGYLLPHFSSNLSNSNSADSLLIALYTGFKSFINSFWFFEATYFKEFIIW